MAKGNIAKLRFLWQYFKSSLQVDENFVTGKSSTTALLKGFLVGGIFMTKTYVSPSGIEPLTSTMST